jgi:opacity protein-like surface antigen
MRNSFGLGFIFMACLSFSMSAFASSYEQVTSIRFNTNSAAISPYNKDSLKDVVTVLKNNPDAKVMLVGNTDGTKPKNGAPGYNLNLAKKRAQAIKQYLLSHKAITANNIKTSAFADMPILCHSPLKSILGRRVDVIYCTSDVHCESSFNDYEAWLQDHCEKPDPLLVYMPKSYDPRYMLTLSYMNARQWTESPRSVTGLKFNDGIHTLGDFDGNKIKQKGLYSVNFAVRVLGNVQAKKSMPFYVGVDYWKNSKALEATGVFSYKRMLPANQYNYQYNLSAQALGLTGQLYLLNEYRFKPYVQLGVGAVKLSTSGFSLAPIAHADETSLTYADKTKTNVYYKLALGADYSLTNVVKIGANYFYADMGKYTVGPGVLGTHGTPAMTKKLAIDGFSVTAAFEF